MAEERHATTAESVLEHHLTAFGDGDLDELLDDYTDESVVITADRTYDTLDEIGTDFFAPRFADLARPEADFVLDEQHVVGDTAFITWHAETPDNTYAFATDTFVVRDGTIVTQTFAGVVTPKA